MNPELNSQFLDKIQVVKSEGCEIVGIRDLGLNKDAKFSKSPQALMDVASGGGDVEEDHAPPTAMDLIDPTRNKQENLKILQDIYGIANVITIKGEEIFIRYKTLGEAQAHSEELSKREEVLRVVGKGGKKKHILFQYKDDIKIYSTNVDGKNESDKQFFGIILTPDNVKVIRAKHEADQEKINEQKRKNDEAIRFLESKNLKFQAQLNHEGNFEYLVTVGEVGEGDGSTILKNELGRKMGTFSIKGQYNNDKVLIPLDEEGRIIYGNKNEYDYESIHIKKFAIILTQKNVKALELLEDDQLSLLRIEAPALAPAVVAAPVARPTASPAAATPAAPAARPTASPAAAATPYHPAPDATAAPAAPSRADQPNHQEILKQKILGGVVLGAVGVGGVLLCASAMGVCIASTPVIGTAVAVGAVSVAIGAVIAAEPIGQHFASISSSRSP
jgi:hypothetical protein